jgi:hypothetical protein
VELEENIKIIAPEGSQAEALTLNRAFCVKMKTRNNTLSIREQLKRVQ